MEAIPDDPRSVLEWANSLVIDLDEDEPVQLPDVGVTPAQHFRLFFERQWIAFTIACLEQRELREHVHLFGNAVLHEAHAEGVFDEYLALTVEARVRMEVERELLAEEQELDDE